MATAAIHSSPMPPPTPSSGGLPGSGDVTFSAGDHDVTSRGAGSGAGAGAGAAGAGGYGAQYPGTAVASAPPIAATQAGSAQGVSLLSHFHQQHQQQQLLQQQHQQYQQYQQLQLQLEQQQQQPHQEQHPHPLRPDDFVRIRTLGTGTFARVCLVRRRNPRDQQEAQAVYALKILRKTAVIKLKQIDHVRHERRILSDVAGHPFITTLRASFVDRDFLYLLLDYIPGGELFSYLRKYRRFDEPVAQFYAAEIVLVLEYLHEQQDGVAYRDLKPENLLLDATGHVKLVDFGFAKRLGGRSSSISGAAASAAPASATATGTVTGTGTGTDPAAAAATANAVETYTLCGTPEYIAPEVIQNMGHTTAVDWWALGILIFEFLTGYPPFWHQNPLEIYRQILEKPVVFPNEPAISPAAQSIVRELCTVDRSRRLGNISGGAARVRAHDFFAGIDWDALLERRVPGPIVPPVRWAGDAQCFDVYPEQDVDAEHYTDEMVAQYDAYFSEF